MPEEPDEHALLRDVGRAMRAEALLNDEMLKEAFSYLEEAYIKAWRLTGVTEQDTHGRERLWQAVNLLGKVQEHLGRVIQNGKLSKRQLAEIEDKKSRSVRAAA